MKKQILILCVYCVPLFSSAPARNKPMRSIVVKARPEKMVAKSVVINDIKNEIEEVNQQIANLSMKKNVILSTDWILFRYFDSINEKISKLEKSLSPKSKQIMLLEKLEVNPKQLKFLLSFEPASDRKKREKIKQLQDDLHSYVTNFRYGYSEYGWQKIHERNELFNKISRLKSELSKLEEMYQIPTATPEEEEELYF